MADLVARLLRAVEACVLRSKGLGFPTQRDICPRVKLTDPPPIQPNFIDRTISIIDQITVEETARVWRIPFKY